MESNGLIISIKKCSYMIYHPKRTKKVEGTKLYLGNDEIKKVDSLTFLGIRMDDSLKFSEQINNLKSKLKSALSALKQVKFSLNYKAKFLIYNGLFQSHLEYCFITYGNKINKTQLQEIKLIQKKALRILFSARFNTHCSKLYQLSGITPVDELLEKESLIFMKKYCNNLQPKAFEEIIGEPKIDSLRSSSEKTYKIPKNLKVNDCFYDILSSWNKADKVIKEAKNHKELKSILKKRSTKNQSEYSCKVKKCYSCKKDKKRDFEKYMKK